MQGVGAIVCQELVLLVANTELCIGNSVSNTPNNDAKVGAWLAFLHEPASTIHPLS